MANSMRITIEQFINSLNYLTNNEDGFMREFKKYSHAGDRRNMIEMLMHREETLKLKITSVFTKKDDIRGQKIFEDAKRIDEKSDGIASSISKINLLNEALSAVSTNNPLLIEIILTRARLCFFMRSYTKCCKDYDYAIELLSNELLSDCQEKEKYKTVFNELKIQALKAIKKNEKVENIYRSPSGVPEVEGKRNKKLLSCSDAVAMTYTPYRGRHLVATKNIKAGSVLIVDESFAFSTDQQALPTNCLNCHVSLFIDDQITIPCTNCQTVFFCSLKCRHEAWRNYHKYECTIFDNFMENSTSKNNQHRSHLLLAYRTTVAEIIDKQSHTLNTEFLTLQDDKRNHDTGDKSITCNVNLDVYDSLDYKTVYSLETHCEKAHPKINFLRSVKAVFLAKCLNYVLTEMDVKDNKKALELIAVGMMRHMQAIDCNAYEIVENIRNEMTKTWEPRNVGGAIYTTVSLVNHSCYPNVVRHSYPKGRVVVRALTFIEKGSEILDCYGPHFITEDLPTRQKYLNEKYHFTCMCDPCKSNWKLSISADPLLRCLSCGSKIDSVKSRCQMSSCSRKVNITKLNDQLTKSIKKRIAAIGKMYDGYYLQALPLLLEHVALIDKILITPSAEAIKTQQSIIQCYNSMGNVSK